jgi:hypothetical protein
MIHFEGNKRARVYWRGPDLVPGGVDMSDDDVSDNVDDDNNVVDASDDDEVATG